MLESTATDESQWKDAFHWYEKASERGDARSHFRLARLYADGKGVATNQTKASEHFLIAAEKGDPRAQSEAGMRYLGGVGVDEDPAKGLALLQQAAEQEDPMALYNLATLQEKQDRPEEREQTLIYYTRAAELGVLPAQIKLIDLYSDDSWNPPKNHELL